MKHSLRGAAVIVMFAGLAIVAAGCSDSRMAANNAASNNGQARQQSYPTAYGLSSEGTTTDLYTELKTSLQRPERPQPADTVSQGNSAGVSSQPTANSASGVNGRQPATSASSVTGQQANNPASSTVQQTASAPREQPTTTAYGIPSDGPTTDLYTELFGPRSR